MCLIYLCIQYMIIQEPRDQRSFDNFPKIIAVFHALHRHLMPRHPPYALNSLAVIIFTSHSAHCLVGAKNITTRFQFTRPCITALHLNRLPKNKNSLRNTFSEELVLQVENSMFIDATYYFYQIVKDRRPSGSYPREKQPT